VSTVGRRGFLAGTFGVLAAVAAPIGWVGRAFAGPSATTTPTEKLAALLTDAEAMEHIGEAYLAGTPDERDATILFGALAPVGELPDAWWADVRLPELRRTMRAATHADFADGAVVDVGGWQLARTECRLAALFTLTRETPAPIP
jgi:hypothetical protein